MLCDADTSLTVAIANDALLQGKEPVGSGTTGLVTDTLFFSSMVPGKLKMLCTGQT